MKNVLKLRQNISKYGCIKEYAVLYAFIHVLYKNCTFIEIFTNST